MPKKGHPDIIPLLKHLCIALEPFASTRQIKLNFTTTIKKIRFDYKASEVLCGLSKLLCSIIDYMPAYNTITIKTELIKKDNFSQLSIKIHNTGINLKMVPALTNNCSLPAHLYSWADNETTFIIKYNLSTLKRADIIMEKISNATSPDYPVFFNELHKRLQLHFVKLNNPLSRLSETHPKESTFLTKINNCILQNMDDEGFDANALSTKMAMSRAQLFRKLKSLISVSPGCYIKSLRLQKGKEMLEKLDLSVSEVAYKTGFQSPSHFTKVFSQKYGFRPSLLRRPGSHATNE